jgi:hypothetical protein
MNRMSGGMGVVYKVEDTRLHRAVAPKFLPAEMLHDPAAPGRFRRRGFYSSSTFVLPTKLKGPSF